MSSMSLADANDGGSTCFDNPDWIEWTHAADAAILEWLNKKVLLRHKVSNIARDFANGYNFGELLMHMGFPIEMESLTNLRIPAAAAHNFRIVFPRLQQLDIVVNERLLTRITRQQPGAATYVLFQLMHLRTNLEMDSDQQSVEPEELNVDENVNNNDMSTDADTGHKPDGDGDATAASKPNDDEHEAKTAPNDDTVPHETHEGAEISSRFWKPCCDIIFRDPSPDPQHLVRDLLRKILSKFPPLRYPSKPGDPSMVQQLFKRRQFLSSVVPVAPLLIESISQFQWKQLQKYREEAYGSAAAAAAAELNAVIGNTKQQSNGAGSAAQSAEKAKDQVYKALDQTTRANAFTFVAQYLMRHNPRFELKGTQSLAAVKDGSRSSAKQQQKYVSVFARPLTGENRISPHLCQHLAREILRQEWETAIAREVLDRFANSKDELWVAIDANGDGSLDMDEVNAAGPFILRWLWPTMRAVDDNRDQFGGEIDQQSMFDELADVFGGEEKMKSDFMNNFVILMKTCDVDGDGELDYDEFTMGISQQLIFDLSVKSSNFNSCPGAVDASSRPKESLGIFLRRLLHRKVLGMLSDEPQTVGPANSGDGVNTLEDRIESIFARADSDKTGVLDRKQFLLAIELFGIQRVVSSQRAPGTEKNDAALRHAEHFFVRRGADVDLHEFKRYVQSVVQKESENRIRRAVNRMRRDREVEFHKRIENAHQKLALGQAALEQAETLASDFDATWKRLTEATPESHTTRAKGVFTQLVSSTSDHLDNCRARLLVAQTAVTKAGDWPKSDVVYMLLLLKNDAAVTAESSATAFEQECIKTLSWMQAMDEHMAYIKRRLAAKSLEGLRKGVHKLQHRLRVFAALKGVGVPIDDEDSDDERERLALEKEQQEREAAARAMAEAEAKRRAIAKAKAEAVAKAKADAIAKAKAEAKAKDEAKRIEKERAAAERAWLQKVFETPAQKLWSDSVQQQLKIHRHEAWQLDWARLQTCTGFPLLFESLKSKKAPEISDAALQKRTSALKRTLQKHHRHLSCVYNHYRVVCKAARGGTRVDHFTFDSASFELLLRDLELPTESVIRLRRQYNTCIAEKVPRELTPGKRAGTKVIFMLKLQLSYQMFNNVCALLFIGLFISLPLLVPFNASGIRHLRRLVSCHCAGQIVSGRTKYACLLQFRHVPFCVTSPLNTRDIAFAMQV